VLIADIELVGHLHDSKRICGFSLLPNEWGAGNFSLHRRVQTGSGANPASYPMGTGALSPGGKAAGA
jgi:hypothetical protein